MSNEPVKSPTKECTVSLCSAAPLAPDDREIHTQILIGTSTVEAYPFDERSTVFAREAIALVDALESSLPGGTLDALLVELLHRQRSSLIVARRKYSDDG